MQRLKLIFFAVLLLVVSNTYWSKDLKLNDLEYFETQGINVLVYNNLFT